MKPSQQSHVQSTQSMSKLSLCIFAGPHLEDLSRLPAFQIFLKFPKRIPAQVLLVANSKHFVIVSVSHGIIPVLVCVSWVSAAPEA